ncbi:hypothetical protein [Carboxylicivirga taeanensis]|uniref:hypothetical protein n=1 Tax=Carboxylicivirga taeanensis TaxID=1416875 RepID=UPI003F6DFC4F
MKIFIIIVLVLLTSCSNRTKKSEQTSIKNLNPEKVRKTDFITSKTDFIEFLETIPELELPIEKMCYDDFTSKRLDYENKAVAKFKPDGAHNIYGKILISENTIGIIYLYPADYIFPSLVIYDSNAEVISEFDFFEGYCGRDYNFYSSSFCSINELLQISRIDTSLTYNMNDEDETIGIEETTVTKTSYLIESNGKIIKK